MIAPRDEPHPPRSLGRELLVAIVPPLVLLAADRALGALAAWAKREHRAALERRSK